MEAVFAVADRITVMVNGTVIATGDPASIRANREVQLAYLGEEEAA
jgi:branched-chain amino acid transport system ATP-binding protein